MIPVSASARVQQRLRDAPSGSLPLVHVGRDAVYADLDGECLGVLGRRAVAVPCGLRTDLERLPASPTVEVRDGVAHLDGEPCVVGRLVDTQVPALPSRLGVDAAGPAPTPDVDAMVGRGDGLTPYQDDVLCGWLAMHRAADVATPEADAAVAGARHRTTLLSATLLDGATRGEVIPEFAAWVRGLGGPQEADHAAALGTVGHSSGLGLLHGARLALTGLRASTDPPAGTAGPTPRQGAA